MNVHLQSTLIGDTICSINCIETIAENEKYKNSILHLKVENPALQIFFKHIDNVNFFDKIDMPLILSPIDFFIKGQDMQLHMTQAYFMQANLPIPSNKRPNVKWITPLENVPIYDFIISPYSWSDLSGEKLWPYSKWQDVIDYLNNKYNNPQIAILGASGFTLEKNKNKQFFTGVDYIFDKPLEYVCELISKTKRAVLTIDNGISHLVHGIGTPHFLIYPICLKPNWVKNFNDNVHTIIGDPKIITVEEVIRGLKGFITQNNV